MKTSRGQTGCSLPWQAPPFDDPELYTSREGTERSLGLGKELDVLRKELDSALETWTAAT